MDIDGDQPLFTDNSAALLKLYLKHDLLEEATDIAMYMFKNTKVGLNIIHIMYILIRKLKGVLEAKKADQTYLPYTLVDQLLQQLKTAKLDKLQHQVEGTMQNYFNVVYSDARKVK